MLRRTAPSNRSAIPAPASQLQTVSSTPFRIHPLTPSDVALMEGILTTFGEAFSDVETYSGTPPSRAYLERLLSSEYFIALAALKGHEVVGGIAAYELM